VSDSTGGGDDFDWCKSGADIYTGTGGSYPAGNVGIGTTSPTAKLQVTGTTLVSNGGIETIFGTAGTPGYRFMGTGVNTGMFAPAANELAFSTNSAERMRINSAGNVGIGTTSPQQVLDLGSATSGRAIVWGGPGGANWFDTIGASYSSAALSLLFNLRTDTTKDQYLVSYTGTYPHTGIRIQDGIHFFAEPSTSRNLGDVFDFPSATRLFIKGDGKVGIGTTSPLGRLHVKCGAMAGDGIIIEGTLYPALKLHDGTAAKGFLFWDHLNGGVLNLNTDGISGNGLMIRNNSVGINTLNPGAYKFYVNGTAYATGGWQSSDLRFKQNIKTIDLPIDKVMNVKGVSFEWKTSEYKDKGFPEGRHYGVIAQEVERVLPEVVMEGPGGEKAVSYTELVPVLIEAVKQQQKEIVSLKEALADNESLKQKLDALEKRLDQMQPVIAKGVQQ
jgi:hypothetical protein